MESKAALRTTGRRPASCEMEPTRREKLPIPSEEVSCTPYFVVPQVQSVQEDTEERYCPPSATESYCFFASFLTVKRNRKPTTPKHLQAAIIHDCSCGHGRERRTVTPFPVFPRLWILNLLTKGSMPLHCWPTQRAEQQQRDNGITTRISLHIAVRLM
ncbi:hypothetical protein EJ06DRAFT_353151 [Trichodelitschia bisporula]|uniref:Uncharacterized protein n=1 Tax=Trichodelitschia bisporula TaxID=703511 RepID=A0A6G1I005_9PEZI|nr:hypothetical protein EJ06DRAFT_353151 [Trichodelitschia bisporula]